jgi:hypothetical protein
MSVVKAIQKISWTAAGGMMDLLKCSQEEIHKAFDKVHNFVMEDCVRYNLLPRQQVL